MSQKSRTFEARERRKCRAKTKYHSWPDAERIQRLNTENGQMIFEIYHCTWCSHLHLKTRKDIPMPKQFRNMLEKAS